MTLPVARPPLVLQFDLGNTCLKWRLIVLSRSEIEVIERGRVFWSQLDEQDSDSLLMPLIKEWAGVDHIWIASVVDSGREQRLLTWCSEHLGVDPSFARSTAMSAGVTNAYKEPERLGVDRWLAILGAWNKAERACIVVDAGSAVTVDLLSEQGLHLGGYIAPGLDLMRNSLLGGTDAVKVNALSPLTVAPGRDTEAAVTGALASMVIGLLDSAKEQLCSQLSGSSRRRVALFLTGGDAQSLLGLVSSSDNWVCEVDLDLVFDGLVCWGRQNIGAP